MMVAIRDSHSDLASPSDVEEGDDNDEEETEQGTVTEDGKPGWVTCTITIMVL